MKENSIDSFEKIYQSLSDLHGNIHILEATIPIERQKAFFSYAEIVKNSKDKDGSIDEYIRKINSESIPLEDKKHAIVFLSVSADIKAFRALERYSQNPQKELNDWTLLALLQARMILENEFSDERQIFISTGLGGKGDKFRFFAFFKANELKPFSDYQKDLILKEMTYFFKKYHGQIEKIEIKNNYFTLLFLSGFEMVRDIINNSVEECNKYGNFINNDFVVTNMRIFDGKDIQKELQKNEE
jgi:hypothetical protein